MTNSLKEQRDIVGLFEDFLSECRYTRSISEETIVGYRVVFSVFLKLTPGISIASLTPQTMATFFKNLQERKRIVGRGVVKSGVKKSTIASYWNKLSAFFTWLVSREILLKNPFKEMQCPTP